MSPSGPPGSQVWYVAYGSNLRLDRLRHYLAGGRPPDALRGHPGARDPSDPVEVQPLWLDGGLCFAGRSSVWGGAVACYEPRGRARVAARGYLLSFDQVADVIDQETRHPPAVDTALRAAVTDGSGPISTRLYGSLVRVGTRRGRAMVTLAAAPGLQPEPPSPGYVHALAAGLTETFGWGPGDVAGYLVRWPGVGAGWTAAGIEAHLRSRRA